MRLTHHATDRVRLAVTPRSLQKRLRELVVVLVSIGHLAPRVAHHGRRGPVERLLAGTEIVAEDHGIIQGSPIAKGGDDRVDGTGGKGCFDARAAALECRESTNTQESPMPGFRITRTAHDAMTARAEADYPEETCGFVFGEDDMLEVLPMRNIQNEMHEKHPEQFSRDSRTAYYFEPVEMQRVLDEKEKAGLPLRSIYHSHPDHDSYFSETDSDAAAPFGEPSFPGVVYLVYSVRDGEVADVKAFDWSTETMRFVEVQLEIHDDA